MLEDKGKGSKFCRSVLAYNANMVHEICLIVILQSIEIHIDTLT